MFTGKLSGTGHYHPGHIIHFNQILANIGGMYDRRTGIVTVRQNGVYSISVRLASAAKAEEFRTEL